MGEGLDRIRAPSDADGGRDRTGAATGEQASQGTPELRRLFLSLPDALRARPRRALLDLSSQHRGRARAPAPTVAALATGGGGASGERLSDSRSRVMIGPTVADVVRSLGNVPLFAGIERGELARLANLMRESSFAEGEAITTEGESGVGFFVIEDGNATVSRKGEILRTLKPGDYFGEIALIDEGPRSATIVASTDLQCRALAAWEFKTFVFEHPEVAWPLLETLVGRLREAEGRDS